MYRTFVLLFALFFLMTSAVFSQAGPSPEPPKQKAPSEPLVYSDPADPSFLAPAPKEDWTVLSAEKSGMDLSLATAVVVLKWEMPEYTRELLRVEWRHGDPMDLYVILPHGVAKPHAILYLYDYLSDTDRFRNDGWCKRATKDGFAAVGFVSAVSGHRFHPPHLLNQWFVSELQESLATTAHDVQMILNYLEKRGDMDVSKVGMFGQDSGAAVAVLAASADSRIAVLDLLNPWGDWPKWLKDSPIIPDDQRARFLKPEFLAKVANLDPVLYLPQLKSRNVRIEFVMSDLKTPKSARDSILASAPKEADILRYEDENEHLKAWKVSGLSGWIEAQLQKQLPPNSQPPASTVASKVP